MTGSVDTDALLNKAWDEYTRHGRTQGLLLGMDKSPKEAFIVGFGAAAAEVDRLRAVIENAPHSAICDSYEAKPCTCWKSRA